VALRIPGVFLQREYGRYYPAGEVMAHLIGFTDVDGRGQEALELAFEKDLAGKAGSRRVIKDRLGRVVEDVESIRTPQDGQTIRSSIDARIQYLAYRELKKRRHYPARARRRRRRCWTWKAGRSSRWPNLPSYNPNNRDKLEPRRTRNRAVTDVFEPGSTLKPFTAAAALEAGTVKPESVIQTAPGELTIGSRHDTRRSPAGRADRGPGDSEVLERGRGEDRARFEAGNALDRSRPRRFRLPPRTGFPGEVGGRLRAYAGWRPIEQATMSYGHGISVSLLQLARAYLVFATDGGLKPVTLVKREGHRESQRVISPATARAVRRMLEMACGAGRYLRRAPRSRATGSQARPGRRTSSKEPPTRRTSTSPPSSALRPRARLA
jgi:cell division protein FtsI (penicillin-binding protein 3)